MLVHLQVSSHMIALYPEQVLVVPPMWWRGELEQYRRRPWTFCMLPYVRHNHYSSPRRSHRFASGTPPIKCSLKGDEHTGTEGFISPYRVTPTLISVPPGWLMAKQVCTYATCGLGFGLKCARNEKKLSELSETVKP